MKIVFPAMAALISFGLATPAIASDLCQVRALADAPATHDPGTRIRQGEVRQYVTQFWADGRGGYYCFKGGYCYRAKAGERVLLKLENCSIDLDAPVREADGTVFYRLVLNRTDVGEGELRVDDVERRLGDLGLCVVCADNAAVAYVKRPKSLCATLVRRALEGNTEAFRRLDEGLEDCSVQAQSAWAEEDSK